MQKRIYAFQHPPSMVHRLDDIRLDDREREAAKAYLRGAETAADAIGDALLRLILMGRKMKRTASRMLGDPVRRVSERWPERRQPAVR